MCKYCNIKNYKYDSIILDRGENCGDYTTLKMIYKNSKYWLYAFGDGVACKKIKYCPFCGKLLKEQRDELKKDTNELQDYYIDQAKKEMENEEHTDKH